MPCSILTDLRGDVRIAAACSIAYSMPSRTSRIMRPPIALSFAFFSVFSLSPCSSWLGWLLHPRLRPRPWPSYLPYLPRPRPRPSWPPPGLYTLGVIKKRRLATPSARDLGHANRRFPTVVTNIEYEDNRAWQERNQERDGRKDEDAERWKSLLLW
jgi:hypothetical protein